MEQDGGDIRGAIGRIRAMPEHDTSVASASRTQKHAALGVHILGLHAQV